jgi:YD repeat-containing protein
MVFSLLAAVNDFAGNQPRGERECRRNNGRISAETNNLTNTQVSYTYDQLNRLATAVSATGGTTNWGLGFSYDVYGNRTAQKSRL